MQPEEPAWPMKTTMQHINTTAEEVLLCACNHNTVETKS